MPTNNNSQDTMKLHSGWFANSRYTEIKRDILDLYDTNAWMKFYAWFRWCVSPYYELVQELPETGKVVDMGCGFGLLTAAASLVNAENEYIGLDADERRIQAAQECLAAVDANIIFKAVDWYSYPLTDISAFVFVDVLHHLPEEEQGKIIAYCAQHLNQGGYILIKDVGTQPRWKYWANYIFDLSTRVTSVTMSVKPTYRSAADWMELGTSVGLSASQISLKHKDYAAHILIKLQKVEV